MYQGCYTILLALMHIHTIHIIIFYSPLRGFNWIDIKHNLPPQDIHKEIRDFITLERDIEALYFTIMSKFKHF